MIGTIALFVALGGGYASAFSGSGSLQKAAVDDLGQTFEEVRSIKGFGMLEARCDQADLEVEYQFDNTVSQAFIVEANQTGTYEFHDSIAPGQMSVPYETANDEDTVKFYLWKNSVGAKAQADITAHHSGPDPGCASAPTKLRILVLNTQE